MALITSDFARARQAARAGLKPLARLGLGAAELAELGFELADGEIGRVRRAPQSRLQLQSPIENATAAVSLWIVLSVVH